MTAPKQTILVDDEAFVAPCAALLPGYAWSHAAAPRGEDTAGRPYVVIASAGAAGKASAEATAKALHDAGAGPIKVVFPEDDRAAGWSIGDALQEGWTGERFLAWLRARAAPYSTKAERKAEARVATEPPKRLTEIWAESKERAAEKRKDNPLYALWQQWGLHLSQNGYQPLANLHNVVRILENDQALKNLCWFDTFLKRVMTDEAAPREWSDRDDINLTLYLQSDLGLVRIGRDIVSQAVIGRAHHSERNCVRDWMDSLKHDGTARLDAFFADCFGAEDSEYTRSASKNFWISMVARVYEPGCKVDNMVVLEGPQGLGKSSALAAIAGDYFAEQHESATNPKAFAEILQGKLLVEISEMDSFSRAEVSSVKQAISCSSDRFRASYARHSQDFPRQCVFVGTTNRDDWNRDETGARRFWPISCRGQVRLDTVRENREQLFAEAVARYKAGEQHWVMPKQQTEVEQEARFQADPWLESIIEITKGEDNITTSFVAEKLGINLERRDRATEMRIGGCLRFLGWKKKVQRVSGQPKRIYLRGGNDAQGSNEILV